MTDKPRYSVTFDSDGKVLDASEPTEVTKEGTGKYRLRKPLAEFIAEGRRGIERRYSHGRTNKQLAEALDRLEELAEENETLRGALRSMRVIKDAEIAELQAAAAQTRADERAACEGIAVDVRIDQPHPDNRYEQGFIDACNAIELRIRARNKSDHD